MNNNDYTIVNGIIRNPGKFEGEPAWAPYFYDAVLNGCCSDEYTTEDDQGIAFFMVSDADRAAFPELAGLFGVAIANDARGFVYTYAFATEASYHSAMHDAEQAQNTDEYDNY